MQSLVFLLTAACLAHTSVSDSCNVTQGTAPYPIFNSAYVTVPSGKFCCPEERAKSNCIPEEEVACHCPGGLVDEPCYHCKTCAKLAGEVCGGAYGSRGRCGAGLVCTVDETDFLQGKDVSGTCMGKGNGGVPVISCVVIECECVYYWLYQYIECSLVGHYCNCSVYSSLHSVYFE